MNNEEFAEACEYPKKNMNQKNQERKNWTNRDWLESEDELDRKIGWIYQLSPHNLWKVRKEIDDLLSKEREKVMNMNVIPIIKEAQSEAKKELKESIIRSVQGQPCKEECQILKDRIISKLKE